MPARDDLKRMVAQAIDAHADEIVNVAQTVLRNPETGFREEKTSRLVCQVFGQLGLPYQAGLAITGVKAVLRGGSEGPCVGVFGELDSLISPSHPYAFPGTGAAHACGHHAQLGMLMAVAYGLSTSGVLEHLAGRVALLAVPAEEYIEIEFREGLRRAGKIEFLGGKPEFIRLGVLDDVDMAMMCHTTSNPEDGKFAIGSTNNGTIAKQIRFIGRSAHAGGAPHLGINALNASALALLAIHANRETFREQDYIRVHPIVTKGGEAVNAVPADVRMETFVRGRTVEAILQADRKVDRALKGGALSVGARVHIKTMPGYLPLNQNPDINRIFEENAVSLVGRDNVAHSGHRTGSTDMGDVSHIMPAIHPNVGGARGRGHGDDYVVEDYDLAVLTAGKALAFTVVDLLADGAHQAGQVLSRWKAPMTREDYLRFMRGLAREETFDPEAL